MLQSDLSNLHTNHHHDPTIGQIRPGTRLRGQLKHFSKVTKERLIHFNGYSIDNQPKTSMDKREARRLGKEALSNVQLFNGLNFNKLSEKLRFTVFRSGEIIIEQAIIGQLLYIVLEGRIAIYVDKHIVATKEVGAILGERSMIFDQLTTAKCIAMTPVRCAFIPRSVFLSTLPEGAIDKLRMHCRMQDTLSCNGTRSYDHLQPLEQLAIFKKISNFCQRLIQKKNENSRFQ